MKRQLKIIQNATDTTCFHEHEKRNICCERKKCPNWISHNASLNCSIICSQKGPYTLDEIGEIFGLSRMRICQLEKLIFVKLRKKLNLL